MSTSLTAQTIESKVDTFTLEQASSQQRTVSRLEKIEDEFRTFASFQSTAQETTLAISRSTDMIHETLHDIRLAQTSSQHTSRVQVERLDATLVAIQRSLLSMPSTASTRSRARRTSRKLRQNSRRQAGHYKDTSLLEIIEEPPTNPAQLNRLIDLAITVRYRGGEARFEALAISDPEFEAADFATKLRMVKYLQDLRVLLWLLSQKRWHYKAGTFTTDSIYQSNLMPEARLVYSWSLGTTLNMVTSWHESQLDEPHLHYLCYMLQYLLQYLLLAVEEEVWWIDKYLSRRFLGLLPILGSCIRIYAVEPVLGSRHRNLQMVHGICNIIRSIHWHYNSSTDCFNGTFGK